MAKLTLSKEKSQARKEAKILALLGADPTGHWAVFKRSLPAKSARFTSLHETREAAEAEAKRLPGAITDPFERSKAIYYVVLVESAHTV